VAYDLIVKGGRVIDPSQHFDGIADIAFSKGKVVALGPDLPFDTDTPTHDAAGLIVTPGLIDLHTHVYWGGTSLGVDGESQCLASGVTTAVDTGSAGAGNFPGFRKHVIERSDLRILAFLHVSFAGIFGYSPTVRVGESEEMRLMAPAQAVSVVEANRDVIVGIKVRVGRNSSGASGAAPLDIALAVADEVGLPLMAHIDHPPPSYEDVVSRLRPGDILTHAFRPFPNTPVNSQGAIKQVVRDARERGVLFDIGHGMGSFAFKTARAMIANGFAPDTISSDIHAFNLVSPVVDQVTTLSKFLHLGMPLPDVIAATTVNAATALRRPELGTLIPGSVGDVTLLSLEDGKFELVDTTGETIVASKRLFCRGVILDGKPRFD
jgi:dihydroorotase